MSEYGDNTRHSVHADSPLRDFDDVIADFIDDALLDGNVVYDLWTVQVIGPLVSTCPRPTITPFMAEAEENLTDLLPEGWRAIIQPWNEE